MRRALIILAGFIFLPCFIFSAWFTMYPDKADAKGFRYVFWKWGLYSFDRKVVYGSLNGDVNRNVLVKGLDFGQVKAKFPELKEFGKFNEYQRVYFNENAYKEDEITWLGESYWAVIFKSGKATKIRLFKG